MRKTVLPLVLAGLLACPMAWADEVSPEQPSYEDGGYSAFYYDGQWSADITDETQWDGVEHAHIGAGDWAAQPGDSIEQPLPGPTNERVEVSQDGMSFWSDGSSIGARVDSIPENTVGWDNWACMSSGNANFWWDDGAGSGQVDYVSQDCWGWNDPEPVDPEPVDPEPVDPEPVDPEPVDPEPVDPEPVDPEPVDPEPVDPEPVEHGEITTQEEDTTNEPTDTAPEDAAPADQPEGGDSPEPGAPTDSSVAPKPSSTDLPVDGKAAEGVSADPTVPATPTAEVTHPTTGLAHTGVNVPGAAAFITLVGLAGVTVLLTRRDR